MGWFDDWLNKFGRWKQQEIDGLERELAEAQAANTTLAEQHEALKTINQATIRQFEDLRLEAQNAQASLHAAQQEFAALKRLYASPAPASTIIWSGERMTEALQGFVPQSFQRIVLQSNYYVPSLVEWNRFNAWWLAWLDRNGSQLPYVGDLRDCDWYGFMYKAQAGAHFGANSVGWVLDPSAENRDGEITPHVYNLVVALEGPALYEPNPIVPLSGWALPGQGYHKFERGMLLL